MTAFLLFSIRQATCPIPFKRSQTCERCVSHTFPITTGLKSSISCKIHNAGPVDGIIVTPTLVKIAPEPKQTIMGDLSDIPRLLHAISWTGKTR